MYSRKISKAGSSWKVQLCSDAAGGYSWVPGWSDPYPCSKDMCSSVFHEHLMAMAQNIRLIGIPNGLVAFRNWPATISLWVIVDLPHIRDGSIANEPTLAHTCPGSDQYYAWKEEGKREFPVLMHLCFDSIVKMIKSLHPKAGYCSSKSTIWIWLVVEPPTEKYHRHAGPSSLCRLQN